MTYKEWHEEDRIHRQTQLALARADRLIAEMHAIIERQSREESTRKFHEDCWRLKDDKGFIRACARFTGNSEHGWRIACGPDGRMIKMVKLMGGWDRMWSLIRACRKYYI